MAKEISPDRKEEFFLATQESAALYKARLLYWVDHTNKLNGQVASGVATTEEQALYVVRLAGIVSDLRARFMEPTLTPEELKSAAWRNQFREEMRTKLTNAIGALYAKFSEDELLWLELRRHEQCHPALDGYRHKLRNDDSWDKRVSGILDKRVFPLAEIEARCSKLERAAGGFTGVVMSLAQRVFVEVSVVQGRMIALLAGL